MNKKAHSTIKNFIPLLALCALLTSCGEEFLTQNTLSETERAPDIQSFAYESCAQMRLVKPPVDILFVVDNTGSTLQNSFQQIKEQIAATVGTISQEFDYHVYIAPLYDGENQTNFSQYPLIVSDVSTLASDSLNLLHMPVNQVDSNILFSAAGGGSKEHGYQRVYDLISKNRSNGIFRDHANTIAVMISNGYDTETIAPVGSGSNIDFKPEVFNAKKQQFLNLKGDMNASSFHFISLVPHRNCHGPSYADFGYKKMSTELGSKSVDLCGGNYSGLFSVVNESIRQVLIGHEYDHWKISSASEADIEAGDITVTKILPNGTKIAIPQGGPNGFEYLGHRTNINTRVKPDAGEPVTGLVIKLNGDAVVKYDTASKRPECLVAKTRTPTEYFGYVVIPREPDLEKVVTIKINGKEISPSASNGWTYEGYKVTENIKVKKDGGSPDPSWPKVLRTGYFFKLNGSSVYNSGDTVNVYYKPKPL